jgi:signal transduction histidine kinase
MGLGAVEALAFGGPGLNLSKARASDLSNVTLPDSDTSTLLLLLLLLFGVLTAVLHIAGRNGWTRREKEQANELEFTRAQLDRANLFLASEPQIVLAWDGPDATPRIEGDLSLVGEGQNAERALAFSNWLEPDMAAKADEALQRLLKRGESFSLTAAGLKGRHFEVFGRAIAGNAVMRVRDVSGDRLQLVRLQEAHARSLALLESQRKLLDLVPNPAWARARDGSIEWVNSAYARAVDAPDAATAVAQKLELFETVARAEAQRVRSQMGVWRAKAPATVSGQRKMFDAYELTIDQGSVGVALDISEIETLRLEVERHVGAYRGIFDQLSTAVAIFDRAKRLTFYNAAYRQIWALDPAFLEQQPLDGEILDALRAKRQLPEQADFRSWKAQTLSAYQAMEPIETVWHLPDGRALRVVSSPNPQGGLTYLFDDATQNFALASQVNAMTRVQGETLDALKEGVAVFGADGRLKLANPAFLAMWRLQPEHVSARSHIDDIAKQVTPLIAQLTSWEDLRATVVGLVDERHGLELRMPRTDGLVLDCASLPLPDGATLLTFFDSTASANVERALTERNEALLSAEKLRNDFVNHVSYELRTPLTNIIGFTQLLADGGAGPLNPKQIEYAGYIKSSSSALLAIINDILDLASIDAGALELRLEDVDVAEAMRAAAEGVQDRVAENNIDLRIVATGDVGAFRADGRRVRQVLFNLLSNAIGFSDSGQTVTLAAMRRGNEIVFKVSDRGRGIAPEALDRVFDRFESQSNGSRHRGPGLGLSIVRALVELHGGRVTIESVVGEGTLVTCFFPVQAANRLIQPAA